MSTICSDACDEVFLLGENSNDFQSACAECAACLQANSEGDRQADLDKTIRQAEDNCHFEWGPTLEPSSSSSPESPTSPRSSPNIAWIAAPICIICLSLIAASVVYIQRRGRGRKDSAVDKTVKKAQIDRESIPKKSVFEKGSNDIYEMEGSVLPARDAVEKPANEAPAHELDPDQAGAGGSRQA